MNKLYLLCAGLLLLNDCQPQKSETSSQNQSLLVSQKTASEQEAEQKLAEIKSETATERGKLEALQNKIARLQSKIPAPNSLDELNDYYIKKFSEEKSGTNSAIFETFHTSRGDLTFSRSDYSFNYVLSTGQLASVRIGKSNSSDNSEMILSWIVDSALAKAKLGYTLISSTNIPTDYGELTQGEYHKGDLYFRTYLQSSRMQGTYGRYSLEYTYYVEIGSLSRVERARTEEYNKKLGG